MNVEEKLEIAIKCRDNKDYKTGIKLCKEVLELQPRNTRGYFILGDIYERIGRFEDAKETYQIGIEMYPMKPELYNNLGRLYYKEKI